MTGLTVASITALGLGHHSSNSFVLKSHGALWVLGFENRGVKSVLRFLDNLCIIFCVIQEINIALFYCIFAGNQQCEPGKSYDF